MVSCWLDLRWITIAAHPQRPFTAHSTCPGAPRPLSGAAACSAAQFHPCYSTPMSVSFPIELDREEDGRWIAEIPDLPGVLCYGTSRDEAIARVQALALRVLAERLEHAEAPAELLDVSFRAA